MGDQRTTETRTSDNDRQRSSTVAKASSLPLPVVHPLLQLHRQIGNRAATQLVQARLSVSQPNDPYEQEADRVADTVMRMPDPSIHASSRDERQLARGIGNITPLAQRRTGSSIALLLPLQRQAEEEKEQPVQTLQRQMQEDEKEEPVQTVQRQVEEEKEQPVQTLQRQVEEEKEQPIQPKATHPSPEVTSDLETRIQAMRGGGSPLPDSTREFFEPRFGYDLSGVRVHTDSEAGDVSQRLHAQAFTLRQDIFFGAGRYQPNTTQGRWLLAHELTHTIQQQPNPLSKVQAKIQPDRTPFNSSLQATCHCGSCPSCSPSAPSGQPVQAKSLSDSLSSAPALDPSSSPHANVQPVQTSSIADTPIHVQRRSLPIRAAVPQIQRSVLDDALDWVAEQAALLPGYTLLTVVIGRNPINNRRVDATPTNLVRGVLELIPVVGRLIFQALQASGALDQVFNWVRREIGQLNLSWDSILAAFRRVNISWDDAFSPRAAFRRFEREFSPIFNGILRFARSVKDRVVTFIKTAILRPVSNFARGLSVYPLLTVILGKDPITDEEVARTPTNVIRGILLLLPGGEEKFQNLQRSGILDRAFNWFNQELTRLNLTWTFIKSVFIRVWDSLSVNDILSPIAAFSRIRSIFAEPIGRILSFAGAAIRKVAEFIFEGVLTLAGGLGQRVLAIFNRARSVLSTIIENPIGFVGNLINAVKRGFQQFAERNRLFNHLRTGLVSWLLGSLQGSGLQLPERFDLRGIVSLVMQILGLTYTNLRGILVRLVGEETVSRAEQVFEFLMLVVTQGLSAAWERIVEFAGNLQETVMGGIRDWVARTVVGQAVARLVTLFNPAGAIIQAIMAIYNTVVFFIERARQIGALAEAVFNSIATIASGNIAAAANFVEQSMARAIPVILGFLARFIGLGGISDQIRNVVRRIQAPINRAMERVAGWIVAQLRRLGGAIVSGARSAGQQVMNWLGIRKPFTATDGSSHTLFFEGQGASAVLTVATTPAPVNDFLRNIRSLATSSSDANIRSTYQTAVDLARDINVVRNRVESGSNPRQPTDIDDLNQKMERLATLLPPLIPLAYPTPAAPSGTAPVVVGELIKVTRSNLIGVVTEITTSSGGLGLVRYRYIRPGRRLSGTEGLTFQQFGSGFTEYVEDPRELYLGPTPDKDSNVGQRVEARMLREGKLRILPNGVKQIKYSRDGQWWNIQNCDMGHIIDAVTWWNSNGRLTGAQSAEVIRFMNDPDNYEFEPSGPNRARGAALAARGIRYLPPVV